MERVAKKKRHANSNLKRETGRATKPQPLQLFKERAKVSQALKLLTLAPHLHLVGA